MESKICIECGNEKALDLFPKHASSTGGRSRKCKQCVSTQYKAYRERRIDHFKERDKLYHQKNREKIINYKRQYRKRYAQKVLERERVYRSENFEKCRGPIRRWSKTEEGKKSMYEAHKRSKAKYPEKHKANAAVKRAVRSGSLTRLPCEVCGDKNTHGHHEDYSKPLEVRWLCPLHHRMVHGKKR